MITDSKIPVKQETAKLIAKTICGEIKSSLAENKKIYDRAERSENQYNQVTKWMSQGKECNTPWEGAADYFIALTEWTVDAVWARVLTTLFSQEPYMTANGRNSENLTDFCDDVFQNVVHLYDNINFYFKQTIKLPFSVAKYDWCNEVEPMMVKDSAIPFTMPGTAEVKYILPDEPDAQIQMVELMMNGYQQGEPQEVWVRKDQEIYNGPKLEYIRFADYVWAPNAKRNTRLYWEGNRFHLTMNEMKVAVVQDKFIKESVEAVVEKKSSKAEASHEKIIHDRAEHIECFHWYGRLPFNKNNEVDFEDPEALEQEVICQVAYDDEELLLIMHWNHSRVPSPDRVYLRGEFEETENFEGRSLSDKLYMTQKEMNTLHNNIMNNANLAMQKIFVRKKSLQDEGMEKPMAYPGAQWEEDQTGDIRVLDVGDVKAIGLQLEQTFLSFAERISNISIYQTGGTRDKGGNKTLGEVQAQIQEGNMGLDKFIRRCHNDLRKICKWTIQYYRDRMPPGMERKVRGENGKFMWPTEENLALYEKKGISPYWSQADLDGDGDPDFTWNGTTLNSSKQFQLAVANDLQDRFMAVPMVQQNLLAVWEILRMNLVARDIKDWDKILPPKDAIVAEMRAAAQNAKLATARDQRPGVDVLAAQKLQGAGMPPSAAVQAIRQKLGAPGLPAPQGAQ